MNKKIENKFDLVIELKKCKTFEERARIDIDCLVDKRHGSGSKELSYISWANCEFIGTSIDDKFTWEVDYSLIKEWGVLKLTMTFLGKTKYIYFPIMEITTHRAVPLDLINQNHINNSTMRAQAKLFSILSGIGLYLFAGEDIPEIKTLSEDNLLPELKNIGIKLFGTIEKFVGMLKAQGYKIDSLTKEVQLELIKKLKQPIVKNEEKTLKEKSEVKNG